MSKGKQIGYIRVSTVDQNTVRQLDGIELDKVFEDKVSGKSVDRAALRAMLEYVRDDDTVHVHSMDRLARNLDDLRQIVKALTARGVIVNFHKENMIFKGDDSPMANLLLSVMGAFAEFERELILERQREGIAMAKKAGKYKGRQPKLTDQQTNELFDRVDRGEKKATLARELGISRASVYSYLGKRA